MMGLPGDDNMEVEKSLSRESVWFLLSELSEDEVRRMTCKGCELLPRKRLKSYPGKGHSMKT